MRHSGSATHTKSTLVLTTTHRAAGKCCLRFDCAGAGAHTHTLSAPAPTHLQSVQSSQQALRMGRSSRLYHSPRIGLSASVASCKLARYRKWSFSGTQVPLAWDRLQRMSSTGTKKRKALVRALAQQGTALPASHLSVVVRHG